MMRACDDLITNPYECANNMKEAKTWTWERGLSLAVLPSPHLFLGRHVYYAKRRMEKRKGKRKEGKEEE